MKRSKKILLATLLLCPLVMLSACVPPPSYLITTSSSDSTYGRVNGDRKDKMVEGSKITLSVIEDDPLNHPFVCWVKDYKTVVSAENALEIEYNEDTAGHYTAVFHEETTSMRFTTLSSIDVETTGFVSIEYKLDYSSSSSGSSNYSLLTEGTFETSSLYKTDNTSVLYFGTLGSNIEYKFIMNAILTDSQGNSSNHQFQFSDKVNSDMTTISATDETSNTTITLTFEKISYDIYQSEIEE